MNGYGGSAMHTRASTAEYTVFMRKSEAERCRLLMERLPSATTSGRWAKSLSASTISATFLAAAEPDAMATEQSASFRASTSFTPSPVMATTWPASRSVRTRRRFMCGVTRPNTRHSATAAATSASVSRVEASTHFSAPGTPTAAAMLDAVRGSSPEMTRMSTPCSRK